MSRALAALVSSSFLLVAGNATAGGAAIPAPPSTPSFSELPSGTMSDPPSKKAPWGIGAGERAPSFSIVRMPGQYTLVKATKSADTTPPPGGAPVCFAQSVQVANGGPGEPPEMTWDQAQANANLPTSAEMGGQRSVQALHSEHLVPIDATTASLEWVDAWVDGDTRGARMIAKGSLPLRVVRNLPGGGQVFAGRDGERIHVVVTSSLASPLGPREQLLALTSRGVQNPAGCHHVRVALRAERTSAEAATIFTTVPLPPLEDAAVRAGLATMRVRPVSVSASVSWASRDRDPIVAIATGWRAREETVPSPENRAGF